MTLEKIYDELLTCFSHWDERARPEDKEWATRAFDALTALQDIIDNHEISIKLKHNL